MALCFRVVLLSFQVGADLCMGSLIKTPGGTIAPGGGYVAGRRPLVDAALARLTAPGVGADAGCVPGETLRLMFQGLFLAPQVRSNQGRRPVLSFIRALAAAGAQPCSRPAAGPRLFFFCSRPQIDGSGFVSRPARQN